MLLVFIRLKVKTERTLGILKPDCLRRKLMGTIIHRLEQEGFEIIEGMIKWLTTEEAEGFYTVHYGQPFYENLIKFMTSGAVFVMLLERDNAIAKLREVMGSTDPAEAAPGTIRREYASDTRHNVIHGSDSLENAQKEIAYFFS